jgi:hypothetical protein
MKGVHMRLTNSDLELLDMTSVPVEALEILKSHFNKPLYQYFGYSEEELDYVPKDGVCVELGSKLLPGSFLRNKVSAINRELERKNINCMAFASEYFIGLAEGNDCIAIIPGNDDMDIVRAAGTAGFNDGITNDMIIYKLTVWKKVLNFDYRVVYADMQQVDLEFISKPKNLRKLAYRVKFFSPEVIDRLENGIDEMVQIMDSENLFTLFWD